MASYKGTSITYDAIGNPLSYYGSRAFTWEGRRLKGATNGSVTMSFKYNDEGIRTSKTVNGVTTNYYLNGTQIIAEETNGNITEYLYNSTGVIGFRYRASTYAADKWDLYFFEKNLQNDIVAVYNTAGLKLISYTYDAWGNFTKTKSILTPTVVVNNPFTYRGYYYDKDLGLYYLNSRYYDSQTGRFISADVFEAVTAIPNALTDKNLYAYCDNNPVMRRDDGGKFWETIFDVISLGASIVEVCVNPSNPWNWVGLAGDAIDLIPFVSGTGEITRATKTIITKADDFADAVDDAYDTAKIIDSAKDTNKAVERSKAVRKAWDLEYENVANGGKGVSRIWSDSEMDELLTTGKVKGYQGHHMKSVKGYPHLAGDPHNIQFLTKSEHLKAHGGNFRNITHGMYR